MGQDGAQAAPPRRGSSQGFQKEGGLWGSREAGMVCLGCRWLACTSQSSRWQCWMSSNPWPHPWPCVCRAIRKWQPYGGRLASAGRTSYLKRTTSTPFSWSRYGAGWVSC